MHSANIPDESFYLTIEENNEISPRLPPIHHDPTL